MLPPRPSPITPKVPPLASRTCEFPPPLINAGGLGAPMPLRRADIDHLLYACHVLLALGGTHGGGQLNSFVSNCYGRPRHPRCRGCNSTTPSTSINNRLQCKHLPFCRFIASAVGPLYNLEFRLTQ